MENEYRDIYEQFRKVTIDDENVDKPGNGKIVFAVSDFQGLRSDQLSFKKGQPIHILQKTNESWWWVEIGGRHGYVPVNHVTRNREQNWQDEEYFGNYGNLKLHHEMLSDRPRTLAYLTAIKNNSTALKDKVILDVGCGTGILSMLCVKHSQPKQVYAVEASDMAVHTEKVVKHNKMDDKILLVHGYAEDVKIGDSVDLIISEWMGTMLVFEMMIESVIIMRDKFLSPGGTIWPSTASLILVPCSAHAHYASRMDFWDNQFGLDFTCFKDVAKEDLLSKPFHDYILPKKDCLCENQTILKFDMKLVSTDDLETQLCPFNFTISQGEVMHGFCTWIEVEFCPLNEDADTVVLNTGPDKELTHWKQNLFLLDEPISVTDGDVVSGSVTISRNPELRRHIRALFDFKVIPKSNPEVEITQCQKTFYIWR